MYLSATKVESSGIQKNGRKDVLCNFYTFCKTLQVNRVKILTYRLHDETYNLLIEFCITSFYFYFMFKGRICNIVKKHTIQSRPLLPGAENKREGEVASSEKKSSESEKWNVIFRLFRSAYVLQ